MMSGSVTVSSCARVISELADSNARIYRSNFISKYHIFISIWQTPGQDWLGLDLNLQNPSEIGAPLQASFPA